MASRRKKKRGGSPAPAASRRSGETASRPPGRGKTTKRRGATGAKPKPKRRNGAKGKTLSVRRKSRAGRKPAARSLPPKVRKLLARLEAAVKAQRVARPGFAGIVKRPKRKPTASTRALMRESRRLIREAEAHEAAERAKRARLKAQRSARAKRAWEKRKALQRDEVGRSFIERIQLRTPAEIRAGTRPPTPDQVARAGQRAWHKVAKRMKKAKLDWSEARWLAKMERLVSREATGGKWERSDTAWVGFHQAEDLNTEADGGQGWWEFIASNNDIRQYRVAVLAVIVEGFF